MKTEPTTQPTFSADLPASWQALTQPQLRYVLTLLAAGMTPQEAAACAALRFAQVCVVSFDKATHTATLRYGRNLFRASADSLATAAETLAFMTEPPDAPVRLERWGRRKALPADFAGVAFGIYLRCQALFAAVLDNGSAEAADELAKLLYPASTHCLGKGLSLKDQKNAAILRYNTLLWMTGLAAHLARLFPDLFRPARTEAEQRPDMRAVTTAMVRALNGGDVTKNQAVLHADTYEALDELNAKAREAEELRRKQN